MNTETLQNIVEAAAALGHRARSNLAGLWNSSIRYARLQNIGKLYEKLGAIYQLLQPDTRDQEQVVVDKSTEDMGQEQVVATEKSKEGQITTNKANGLDAKTAKMNTTLRVAEKVAQVKNGAKGAHEKLHTVNTDSEDESAKSPEETGRETNKQKKNKNQKIIVQRAKKMDAEKSKNDAEGTELRQDFGSRSEDKANIQIYRKNKVATQKFSGQFGPERALETIHTARKGCEKLQTKICTPGVIKTGGICRATCLGKIRSKTGPGATIKRRQQSENKKQASMMQKIMDARVSGTRFIEATKEVNAKAWAICEIMRHKLEQKNLPDCDEQYRKLWNAVGYMTSRTINQLEKEMQQEEKDQLTVLDPGANSFSELVRGWRT